MKKALIFGASGLIGGHLLKQLLKDDRYSEVRIVVRKPVPTQHPKLKILIGDLASLPKLQDDLLADDVFIALGTTKKRTPNEKEYYRIDHDYPIEAARSAKKNGATSVLVVSSVGANAQSKIFYTRTKGEMERDLIEVGYQHTHIFRPSMLIGERQESRPFERALMKIFLVANKVLSGRLEKYKGIQAEDVAKAMVTAAQRKALNVEVYHHDEMMRLVKSDN